VSDTLAIVCAGLAILFFLGMISVVIILIANDAEE